VRSAFAPGLPLREALAVAVRSLGSIGGTDGARRALPASQLEVAVLDRNRGKRKFKRITGLALSDLLPAENGAKPAEPATPAETEGETPAE
jgi:proteasome alpha subunit